MSMLAWGPGGPGYGPGPWFLFFPLFWAAVIFAVVAVRRRVRRGGARLGGVPPWAGLERGTEHMSPTELLDRRFAEGRISAEEYRERRSTLADVAASEEAYSEKFGARG